MIANFPVELWESIIVNHHDCNALLPLQRASKQLYALSTPFIYSSILITFSDSDSFADWATSLSGHADTEIPSILAWKPQDSPYTTFPHISIPFHRLSKLHAAFSSNPSLAAHTSSLLLNPFSEFARLVNGWEGIVRQGWKQLRAIMPFFTNLQRVSIPYSLSFPPEILHSLPTTCQLTHIEIQCAKSTEAIFRLFKLHPNLQSVIVRDSITSSTVLPANTVIDLPRLARFDVGAAIWSDWICRLSILPLRAVRHISLTIIEDIPSSIPPTQTLNNLLSLRLSLEDPSHMTQICPRLRSVEYLSIKAMYHDASDIQDIFDIPSESLLYIHLLLSTTYDTPTVTYLFNHFPTLVIVDWESFYDHTGSKRTATRFLRGQPCPTKWDRVGIEPFQTWWGRARGEIERLTSSK